MAAPQTCWIEWNDESEEAEFFHTAPTGGPNDVRYLRADLTCGECALHGYLRRVPGFEDDAPCPHECATLKHEHTWPRADGAACMAFAPKAAP